MPIEMEKRLLFVDDEEILRELYASLDTVLGADHEIYTAASGREALELARNRQFDVIISDLAMPGMDGVEFLKQMLREHPESARIVISGFADRLKVAECLTVGHRFFNKPLNLKALTTLLQRICQYGYLVNDDRVRKIVCGNNALPTPPDTYLQLSELLNSEYTDIDDVGRLVAQDAGLSTKLLHIVNSAHFGMPRQIASPAEAVQFLGIEVLRALMLGTQVFHFYNQSLFVRATFAELWNHSLKTALAARKLALAEHLPTSTCEECFLTGLLHDIGKLILAANAEAEYKRVVELAAGGVSLSDAEKQIFGATHAHVGAYLLALWGIPDVVIRAIELHHSLEVAEPAGLDPLLAVHIAQNLEPGAQRENRLDNAALERAGLLARVPIWTQILTED
jgi:putative nucleotidyltransferase with HDIG domain